MPTSIAELALKPVRGLAEWVRARALAFAAALILVYFGYHAIHGERGILAWLETTRDYELARAQLTKLEAEHAALRQQAEGLRPDRLDADRLEGELRKLGYIRPEELILLGPSGSR